MILIVAMEMTVSEGQETATIMNHQAGQIEAADRIIIPMITSETGTAVNVIWIWRLSSMARDFGLVVHVGIGFITIVLAIIAIMIAMAIPTTWITVSYIGNHQIGEID